MRAQLAQVAFDLFRDEGFDKVTIEDLAKAAGVGRSTFLRYFASKEEAVLSAFDGQGDLIAGALCARPADEDDWTALRHALDILIEAYHEGPDKALALSRLVRQTPSLRAWRLEHQQSWGQTLTQALTERAGTPQATSLAASVRAAAALGCFNAAVDHWAASDGDLDLGDLLDEAFAALTAV
ncbi:TetR family transcriptional regulator [Streptomyces arenae]|uniref:TetR family transcriptional regulator n=1 Tax=Streptomyces arenae TaxID=29301 RepID=UPI00265A663E|nr:TetR family transcriptional regulator [Streptomyces arenae]MCG7210099.1 TetR/AcrR family transcriptional regulator [Streptomyces arenae]